MSANFPLGKSKDGTLYIYKGEKDDKFEFVNVVTGQGGLITREQAEKVYGFTVPFSLNMIINESPNVLYLIKELKMKLHGSK